MFNNGVLLAAGVDYQLVGNTIALFVGSTPQPGDALLAGYRYANPSNPLGSLTAAQVVCSSTGSQTSVTSLTSLGTCTLPAGLLGAGDRLEIDFQYAHTGSANGFTGKIQVGGTTLFCETPWRAKLLWPAARRLVFIPAGSNGTRKAGGGSLAFQTAAGSAAENTSQALTVNFLDKWRRRERIRWRCIISPWYPAEVNP